MSAEQREAIKRLVDEFGSACVAVGSATAGTRDDWRRHREDKRNALHAAIDAALPGVQPVLERMKAALRELWATQYPSDWQDEFVKEIDALLAHTAEPPINAAPVCQSCGEPQSKNPHPKAGDPSLEFGYEWHCIPCLVRTRSSAMHRAWVAETALRELQAAAPNEPSARALIEALEMLAAQSSGVIGSTAKADCMAAIAEQTLRNYREAAPQAVDAPVALRDADHHGTYRHYKGGLYDVLAYPEREADGVPMVVYRSHDTMRVWVRPLAEWREKFTYERAALSQERPNEGGTDV
jgi:hypothetical protein